MAHDLRLAHDHDLDLAGKGQFGFDALGYVEREHLSVFIADLLAADHDADFAAGVDRVHVFDAGKRGRDFFQARDAAGIAFKVFAAPPRPNGRYGIGRLNQEADRRKALVILVVLGDDFPDDWMLVESLAQLNAQFDVASFHLLADGLANIVQEAGPLGQRHIQPNLGGHSPGQMGDL